MSPDANLVVAPSLPSGALFQDSDRLARRSGADVDLDLVLEGLGREFKSSASGVDYDRSVDLLAQMIRRAVATGLKRQFVDADPDLAPVVERFLQRSDIEGGVLAFAACVADGLRSSTACRQVKERLAVPSGDGLTARERDVLKLIGEGRTNKTIAQIQGVAPETVKTHVKNIFTKLGVERRAQAVVTAQRLGMLKT